VAQGKKLRKQRRRNSGGCASVGEFQSEVAVETSDVHGLLDEVAASNARRLISQNELAAKKSRLALEKLTRDQASGVFEKQAEVERKILDGQLSGVYSPAVSSRLRGWVTALPAGSSGRASSPAGSSSRVVSDSQLSDASKVEELTAELQRVKVEYGKKVDSMSLEHATLSEKMAALIREHEQESEAWTRTLVSYRRQLDMPVSLGNDDSVDANPYYCGRVDVVNAEKKPIKKMKRKGRFSLVMCCRQR